MDTGLSAYTALDRRMSLCLLLLVWSCAATAHAQYQKQDNFAATLADLYSKRAKVKKHLHVHQKLMADFPRETDWLSQSHSRPEFKNRKPLQFAAYLTKREDASLELKMIEEVIAELKSPGPARKRLEAISSVPPGDARWLELFTELCRERRIQRLKPLLAEHNKILFTKRGTSKTFFAYTEALVRHMVAGSWKAGGALCRATIDVNGDVKIETLLEDTDGMIRDIDVHYSGKFILFAWKKNEKDDDYSLYEMELASGRIRQVTNAEGEADFEGCYLPNDDILFSSTRCIQLVDCSSKPVSSMYTCDRQGKYIRRLGFDQVHTTFPTVTHGGTVFYTRWDYNDRGQIYPQPLFQMNPDGTGQTEYYGNNSVFPTTINHARSIPGSSKVMAVLHGHHSWQAGKLAVIDRTKGTQEGKGISLLAPMRPAKRVKVDSYGQDEELFRHPWPLSEDMFLVSMTTNPRARADRMPFGLYFMYADGRRELIAYDSSVSCVHSIPEAPRKRPPSRPTTVDYTKDYGTFYVQDVYTGQAVKGIKRGSIKKLRIVALEFRHANMGRNSSRGDYGGAGITTPISVGNGAWDVKRIIGEVDVHNDGSAMFRVPARTPVYFQLIDNKDQVAQTMRSWSTLMPGETFGCVGCHENKNEVPLSAKSNLAMKRKPQTPVPFQGITNGFSFVKHVQPVLDKHCISCHDGVKQNPKTEKPIFSLSGKTIGVGTALRKWSFGYINLSRSVKRGNTYHGVPDNPVLNWMSAQSGPEIQPIYHRGSAKSKLFDMLESNHGKCKLTSDEMARLRAWVDLCVPFCGDYMEAHSWNEHQVRHYVELVNRRNMFEAEEKKAIAAFINDRILSARSR